MYKRQEPSVAGFALGVLSGWLIILGIYPNAVGEACATREPYQGWYPNSSLNYVVVTFTDPERSQINAAMGNWTEHNTLVGNCSNVGLYQSALGSYVITSNTGQDSFFPTAVATTSSNHPSGYVSSATTTFYWGATFAQVVPRGIEMGCRDRRWKPITIDVYCRPCCTKLATRWV